MSNHNNRSLEIPGVSHGTAPIPMGSRVGNMIFTSGISGKNPATNKLGKDAAEQAFFAFKNLESVLNAGGGDMRNLGHLTILVTDDSSRDAINVEWLRYFPNPSDRPARHTSVQNLRGGALLQLIGIAAL
jgi:2-iminobutanoate/2-iminopropanoate deaminase